VVGDEQPGDDGGREAQPEHDEHGRLVPVHECGAEVVGTDADEDGHECHQEERADSGCSVVDGRGFPEVLVADNGEHGRGQRGHREPEPEPHRRAPGRMASM
jgi:hypothetical protein